MWTCSCKYCVRLSKLKVFVCSPVLTPEGPGSHLGGFIDGRHLRPDSQRDVFVLRVPAVQIAQMLVPCLPPEVKEAICNCVVLKHDVVNMPVFLFDKVQASGRPLLAPVPSQDTHTTLRSCSCTAGLGDAGGSLPLPSAQLPPLSTAPCSGCSEGCAEHPQHLGGFTGTFCPQTEPEWPFGSHEEKQ